MVIEFEFEAIPFPLYSLDSNSEMLPYLKLQLQSTKNNIQL